MKQHPETLEKFINIQFFFQNIFDKIEASSKKTLNLIQELDLSRNYDLKN